MSLAFLITHDFVSPHPNSADPTLVSKTKWENAHTIAGLYAIAGNPNGVLSAARGAIAADYTNAVVYQNTSPAVGTVWTALAGSAIPQSAVFMNGADGALNFDGVTTPIAGATLSGGVYTLNRIIYPSSMAIASGVTIDENNYFIACSGAIVGAGSGVCRIHNNGNAAPAQTAGAAIVSATAKGNGYFAATTVGGTGGSVANQIPAPFGSTTAGAAGGAGSGAGSSVGVTPTPRMMGGGAGGASVTGSSGNAGGSAAAATCLAAASGYDMIQQMTGKTLGGSTAIQYGTGGGIGVTVATGAGAGTNPTGGGAGGGAGICFVAARSITGVTISANGGAGSAGATGTIGTGRAASGGGGGGGGTVVVHYGTRLDAPFESLGGVGGNFVVGGAGCTASAGGAGSPGWIFPYNLSGDGT